jgi:hypothetical protein
MPLWAHQPLDWFPCFRKCGMLDSGKLPGLILGSRFKSAVLTEVCTQAHAMDDVQEVHVLHGPEMNADVHAHTHTHTHTGKARGRDAGMHAYVAPCTHTKTHADSAPHSLSILLSTSKTHAHMHCTQAYGHPERYACYLKRPMYTQAFTCESTHVRYRNAHVLENKAKLKVVPGPYACPPSRTALSRS